jgi:hypothetical protein
MTFELKQSPSGGLTLAVPANRTEVKGLSTASRLIRPLSREFRFTYPCQRGSMPKTKSILVVEGKRL